MPKFCTLFSGSSGNCTFISDGETNLLIDAGVSAQKVVHALASIGYGPSDIDGILLTHEHSDHIAGVGNLSRNYGISVYANKGTMEKTAAHCGWIYDDHIHVFKSNEKFEIGGIDVFPFSIPHDTIDPVGYTFRFNGKYYSVATDMGYVTDLVLKHLCKSEAVLIESNHDVDMLKNGPYPQFLKSRILGQRGHLSNENAALLATQLAKWGTTHIVLGHLSEKNNTYDSAYSCTSGCLESNGIAVDKDVFLKIAPSEGVCEIL